MPPIPLYLREKANAGQKRGIILLQQRIEWLLYCIMYLVAVPTPQVTLNLRVL